MSAPREWLTPQTVLYVAEHLLSQYQSDPDVKLLVDNIEWYILPVANPDGYVYSWTTDRFCAESRNGYGVDLNRNWGYQWGGEGSSGVTTSDLYRGPSAFSEPETQAARFLGGTPECSRTRRCAYVRQPFDVALVIYRGAEPG